MHIIEVHVILIESLISNIGSVFFDGGRRRSNCYALIGLNGMKTHYSNYTDRLCQA